MKIDCQTKTISMLLFLGKILFLCFTLYLLFYYCAGLYSAIEHDLLSMHHFWIGLLMLLLIVLNMKFFSKR